MTVVRTLPFVATGPNAATLPRVTLAAPVALEALYLPSSWNADTRTWANMMPGKGHDLTATVAQAPALTTAGAVKYLAFDGTKVLSASLTLPQPFTFYALARIKGFPSSGRAILGYFSETPWLWAGSIFSSGQAGSRFDGVDIATTVFGTALDTGWHTHMTQFDGAASLAGLDAGAAAGAVTTTAGAVMFKVGGRNADAGNPVLNADIAALAIAPKALTATERASLRAYLLAQTNLT